MSGSSVLNTLRRITLKLAFPAIMATVLTLFVNTIASFEVPALLGLPAGIQVFTSAIYQAIHQYPSQIGLAASYSVILLLLTTGGIYVQARISSTGSKYATVTGKGFRPRTIDLGRWRYLTLAIFILYFLLIVILPFLVGGALAYFLDPIADRLERAGLSRVAATTVITAVGILILVALVLAVIPTLVNQTTALINAAPDIAQRLQMFLLERFPELADNTSTIRQSLAQIGQTIQAKGATLAEGVLNSLAGAISIVVFILVVPVVAFYLMLDWDHMIARIDGLLPRDHAPTVRRLAGEIDAALSAFVRGQLSVCLVLGIYYSAALMLAGLQFGLVVGAIAGAITFIPYVGAIVGGVLAIGLALFQFWGDWLSIGIIAGIAQDAGILACDHEDRHKGAYFDRHLTTDPE